MRALDELSHRELTVEVLKEPTCWEMSMMNARYISEVRSTPQSLQHQRGRILSSIVGQEKDSRLVGHSITLRSS